MKRDRFKMKFDTVEELADFLKENQTGTVVHFMYNNVPTTGKISDIKVEKTDMSLTHTTNNHGQYRCEIRVLPAGRSESQIIPEFYSTKEELIQAVFGIAPCAVACQNYSPAKTK